jgi:hypothetical protein
MKETTLLSTNYMAILNSEISELEFDGFEHTEKETYRKFSGYKDGKNIRGKIGFCFNGAEVNLVLSYEDNILPPPIKDLIKETMNDAEITYNSIGIDSYWISEIVRMSLSQKCYVSTKSVFKVSSEKIPHKTKQHIEFKIEQNIHGKVINHKLIYNFKTKRCQ